MASGCRTCFDRLTRRKLIDLSTITETKLSRCLSTLDLTALGIGSTLGAGIYVVAGQVAREVAGPSVIISFFIAAVASVFAGLCYAEFGARVPRTGSAYVYSYVTVGEFCAFVIGWNLILEYVIGTASVARAWSTYFDSLIDNRISHYFNRTIPMNVPTLSEYPDLFALGITLLLTVVLAVGVKESSIINNIFTGVNLLVVAYVIICGLFKVNLENWKIPKDQVPPSSGSIHNGDGGFMPHGVSGMLSGAATCFYAFVGFDCIATTGEEVRNPQKAIPIAIIFSLMACFFAYFGISAILTLMVPYYSIDSNAPLPIAFAAVGWPVAKYVIAVGAVCGLSTSLLGAMFPMPRVIYAMASDGLLFRFLAHVSEKFKTPFIATIVSGLLAGVMAMLFDLKELVDMMSIGTLLAYTLVAASVLILRYEVAVGDNTLDHRGLLADSPRFTVSEMLMPSTLGPNPLSASVVKYSVLILGIIEVGFSAVLIFLSDRIFVLKPEWWTLLLAIVLFLLIVTLVTIIWRQPENTDYITFKVPAAPLVSSLSIFINVYLMLKLNVLTWIRFGIWMVLGLLIYFFYGAWHSTEEIRMKQQQVADDASVTGDPFTPPLESLRSSTPRTERTQLIDNK